MRVIDETPERKPSKIKIYEVRICTYRYTKTGRTKNYDHTIKYPGWEEFFGD